MKILSLDVATKTGWYNGGAGGVWDLKTKRDESGGMALIRFEAKLTELYELAPFDIVVFEMTAGRHKAALISQAEKHGALKQWCHKNNVEYKSYSAPAIKKFATGKGNCGKPEMIKACKEKYGIDPVDDNHADSIHLWHLAMEDLLADKL